MSVAVSKEKILDSIKDLPENVSIEEVMERLYLLYKIEKGIQQADAGLTISHEEAQKRLGKWLK
ncbi:MAG: hypothetical protein GXO76_04560 [Calditrichaeota bacterium]|nr:hypothetical protein [Calditrichota bacterium]